MTLRTSIATLSHTGLIRDRNEDSVGSDPGLGLLVVADGMGGHPSGDVASRIAVDEAVRVLRGTRPSSDEPTWRGDGGHPMAEAVEAANRRIRVEALRNPAYAGMGTTLTLLRVDAVRVRWHVGHVGDSRAYLLREGALGQLTRDDTWVQGEVDAGRLTPRAARGHPWSSLLSQALGLEEPVSPSVLDGEVLAGDVFLLCSDGLIAHVDHDALAAVLGARLPDGLQAAAEGLVAAALEGGGTDNVTVGLLRVEDAGVTPHAG